MLITGIQIDGQAANADLSAGTERQARAPPWAPLTRAAPLGQALREARHWEGITDRSWGRYEPKSSSLCLTFFDRKCLLAPKVLRGRGGDQSLGQPVRHYRVQLWRQPSELRHVASGKAEAERAVVGIQQLRITGFRSLRDVTWTPGKLNIIIGPNGSGKSNLMRALVLLQKSAVGELPQEILRMGGIAPLLWDGQAEEISWSIQTDPLEARRDPVREALTYELRLRRLGASSAYRVEHEQLANYYLKNIGQKLTPKKFLERRPDHAVTFDSRRGASSRTKDLYGPTFYPADTCGCFSRTCSAWSQQRRRSAATDDKSPVRVQLESRSPAAAAEASARSASSSRAPPPTAASAPRSWLRPTSSRRTFPSGAPAPAPRCARP